DRFIVEASVSKDKVERGEVNPPISEEVFNNLFEKVTTYLNHNEELFVFNGYAGADPHTQLTLQVGNEFSWHKLFAKRMFIHPETKEEAIAIGPEFTIVSAPTFKADPEVDGTKSEVFVLVSLEKKIILIGGTEYGG